ALVAGVDIQDGAATARLAAERNFRHFDCDLAIPEEIAGVFARIDDYFDAPPDVLCCVAGIAPELPYLATTTEELDHVIAVTLRARFLCGQEAARRMIRRGAGRIVNIASTATEQAWAFQSAYGASKGAIATLTKCMAVELGPHGILVNAVGPGSVHTPASA